MYLEFENKIMLMLRLLSFKVVVQRLLSFGYCYESNNLFVLEPCRPAVDGRRCLVQPVEKKH